MKIAIVGCGKLGSAIAKILTKEYEILAIRRDPSKIEFECEKSSDVSDAKKCDFIILTLKPQDFRKIIKKDEFKDKIVISFMAGVSVEELKKVSKKVVRAMTTLAVEYGESFVTFYCDGLSPDEEELIIKILKKLGEPIRAEEEIVDVSTAFASSIAFISELIEALIFAGVRQGIKRDIAEKLSILTFHSCLKLVEKYGCKEVVDKVATPAGATVEGLAKLMECKAAWCLQEAFCSAAKKFKKS